MPRLHRSRRPALAGLAVVLLAVTGCTTSTDPAPPTAAASATTESTSAVSASATQPATQQPFGTSCPNLPDSGVGSLVDLSNRDWVDALAEVPALSQLSVTTALSGLVNDLDGVTEATVFAPSDTAFRRLGLPEGRRLLTDPARAVDVLSYHVVPQRLSPDDLAGSHQTLTGKTVEIDGAEPDFTVNGRVTITCGNIQTRNATIYLVDEVLQPS